MPKFLRVPWIRWQRFRVSGRVREQESGRPITGLRVCAFDQDVVQDDFLGETTTDADGRFEIHFTDAAFKDFSESRPDLYLCLFREGSRDPIVDTSYEVRDDASEEEYYDIAIPVAVLGSDPPSPSR